MEQIKNQELFQSKITFFTQVAHEIKTPVSLIKAPLEAILETREWNSEVESNRSVIQDVYKRQPIHKNLLHCNSSKQIMTSVSSYFAVMVMDIE